MTVNQKKVLFISPCKTSAIGRDRDPVQKLRTNMSLPGVMILGALEKAGCETYFMDLTTEDWGHQWMVGNHVLAYGLSSQDTVNRIEYLKPDFVIITSMFTFECMLVDELVQAIKRSFPDVCVILGGIHASQRPEWHFEVSEPDFIVIGEGEETIVELVLAFDRCNFDPSMIPGIAFRDNTGKIVRTRVRHLLRQLNRPWALNAVLLSLSGTPRYLEQQSRKAPAYVDDIIGENIPAAALYGSRGCPRSCSYCSATRRTGRTIRHVGAIFLFRQFLKMRQEYGVGAFANQADTFGLVPDDLDFLGMVKEYRQSSGDTSFVLNNPNAFFLEQFFPKERNREINLDFLELLRNAGINTITIAIETLSQRFSGKVNWGEIRPEMVYELCRTIRAMGFKSDIYMMYGFPGQTEEEFAADLRFGVELASLVDLITWSALSLFPGTRLYDKYVVRSGKENAYRRIICEGYSAYYPREEFNLSEVNGKRFSDSLSQFGQSWV